MAPPATNGQLKAFIQLVEGKRMHFAALPDTEELGKWQIGMTLANLRISDDDFGADLKKLKIEEQNLPTLMAAATNERHFTIVDDETFAGKKRLQTKCANDDDVTACLLQLQSLGFQVHTMTLDIIKKGASDEVTPRMR